MLCVVCVSSRERAFLPLTVVIRWEHIDDQITTHLMDRKLSIPPDLGTTAGIWSSKQVSAHCALC